MEKRKIILLIGAPGAGKGTVGQFLEERGFKTLSTGNVVRKEIQAATPLGRELAEKNAKGLFFSDELAIEIGKKGIAELTGDIVLDGFPRNVAQAAMFDAYLAEIDEQITQVLHLNGDKQVIVNRLKDRRVCPACGASFHLQNTPPKKEGICDRCQAPLIQRADDVPETIEKRMDVYEELTKPLVDYYTKKGLLKEIPSDVPAAIMNEKVHNVVEKKA